MIIIEEIRKLSTKELYESRKRNIVNIAQFNTN